MDVIHFAINNPVKVAVGVLLLLLFGVIALVTIPIQLVPDVDKPVITVETNWTGRSPEEVEKEIIEEQEDRLKSLSNLRKMVAVASQDRAEITLEFYVGADMGRARQEVSDKLREVPDYPDDVDEPVISVADNASENAIAWMILSSGDPNFDVQGLYDEVDRRIKPYLERIEGLAEVNVYGGREQQVHIQIDPLRVAQRGVTFNQLRQALQLQNVNVSAGDIADGRLDVRVRTVGQYDNVDDVANTIVTYDATGGPIRIKDLGTVVQTLQKRRTFVRSKGQVGLAINGIRESGANVIEVMEELRKRVAYVNANMLPTMGPQLTLTQVYDETIYIYDALDLVLNNLWLGGALAAAVLLLYLTGNHRPATVAVVLGAIVACLALLLLLPEGTAVWFVVLGLLGVAMLAAVGTSRATGIIGVSIPVSVIGTFVAMTAFGRNLNVISLAGLAFAVGMVVDNSIVVLENIDRHIHLGKPVRKAAYDATKEVWGAVLASTLTTLAVFVPVLFIEEEAGQLFRDIALAICAAVALSLIVSVTVVPTLGARFLRRQDCGGMSEVDCNDGKRVAHTKPASPGNVFAWLPGAVAGFVTWVNRQPLVGGGVRVIVSLVGVALLLTGSIMLIWAGDGPAGALAELRLVATDLVLQLTGVVWIVLGVLALPAVVGLNYALRRQSAELPVVLAVAVAAVLAIALGAGSFRLPDAVGPLELVGELAAHWIVVTGLALVLVGVLLLPVRLAVVGTMTLASVIGGLLLMPPTTYLPQGNRNLVFGIMLTPPAYNAEQNETIGERIEAGVRPFWEAKTWEETRLLQPAVDFMTGETFAVPPVENYFFVSWGGIIFMGAVSADKEVVKPLGPMLSNAMGRIPGSFGFAEQVSLFGRGLGGSNAIEVEVSGDDLDAVRQAAGAIFMPLAMQFGFDKVRPDPLNFNLTGPELRIEIDRVRAADLGIDVASLGLGVQALVDGAIVGDYRYGGQNIDLLLVRDPKFPLTPETLGQIPVAASDEMGKPVRVPLSQVATLTYADAPQQVRRIEQQRAVTLIVVPPDGVPLEQATNDIAALRDQLVASGQIPSGITVDLAGTADDLQRTRQAMLGEWTGFNFQSLFSLGTSRLFLALLVTYLLMAALFESWLYPFVILFSVPLATVGGFFGLRLVHTFDPTQLLDVLTMLGFVILIGVVVNNAILIVHQSLNFMRGIGEGEGDTQGAMPPLQAIHESVRTRIRPIMMTTTTSLLGMLPLVVMPGSGSELYRGLGAVVLGGLAVSTLFTLIVVPVTFALALDARAWVARTFGWTPRELAATMATPATVDAGGNGGPHAQPTPKREPVQV